MRLVALHGYPLDRRMWDGLAALAGHGAMGGVTQVMAPDLRGRGTSGLPAAEIHTMSLLADDVSKALPALAPGEEPFLLCGFSMGGYVAFEFLRRHGPRLRERVAGLVLCDTRAGADDEAGRAKRMEAIEAIRRGGIDAALQAMLPRLLSPKSKGTEAEARCRDMILATPPETACADLAGMAMRRDGFDVLGAFDRPVLLVCGDDDVLTPVSEAEAMAEACASTPFVRLLTIPDAGHLAPLERPFEVASAIGALSRRLPAGSP
jgi:3-oxoadipate enol-lactonase